MQDELLERLVGTTFRGKVSTITITNTFGIARITPPTILGLASNESVLCVHDGQLRYIGTDLVVLRKQASKILKKYRGLPTAAQEALKGKAEQLEEFCDWAKTKVNMEYSK